MQLKTVITFSVVTRSVPNPTSDGAFRIIVDSSRLLDACVREKRCTDGTWTRVFRLDARSEALIFEELTMGTPPVIIADGERQLHLGDFVLEPLRLNDGA